MIPKNALKNDEAIKELYKIKEIEKTFDREKIVYRASEYTYNFRNFRTIKAFGRDIYEGNVTLEVATKDQNNWLRDITNFSTIIIMIIKYRKKKLFLNTCINFSKEEKYFLMVLMVEYF